jgi:outer membrane protein assembly factor BamB
MQWDFDRVRDDARGGSTGDGWAYAIYAWMPPMRSGEAARTTVKYIINHQGSKDSVDVKINQALPENQGRWVKIGSSYFNVDFVTMMIVPDTIGPFGYCSPIADVGAPLEKYPTTEGTYNAIGGGDILADHIYVVTSNGRALSFAAGGSDKSEVDPDRKCLVEWVYPAIRTSKSVTGSGTDDMPSMGQIGASPAYYDGPTGKLLFIAGYDGKVHCVNAINGEKMWIYEDTQSGSDPFGGPMGLGGFIGYLQVEVSVCIRCRAIGRIQVFDCRCWRFSLWN